MRIALDANRYTDFQRGVPEAVEALQTAEVVGLPFIVIGELRAGFRSGTRARENERRLGQFLTRDRVLTLWPDDATTHLYADLFADLRRAGTPIPTNDLWIAALCLQHELVLFTRDERFATIPRLARL